MDHYRTSLLNFLRTTTLHIAGFMFPLILICGILPCSCAGTQLDTESVLSPGMITIHVPDQVEEKEAPSPLPQKTDAEKTDVEKINEPISSKDTAEKDKTGTDNTVQKNDIRVGIKNEVKETAAADQKEKLNIKKKIKLIPVDIYMPHNRVSGDLLVLPGWKFSRKRWQKETDILKYADEYGLRVVFPEMDVTVYESEYFPETTMKWSATPGSVWLKKILIPHLRKQYGLFKDVNKNFLLGMSTGGRGVVMTALKNPGLFMAGAALSGDFNQLSMPMDRLMTSVYGPYKLQIKRWMTVDNPEVAIHEGKWEMPLYLGHGKDDRISPFTQSASLYETIKKRHPKVPVRFNSPEKADHDFKFWNSELLPVIKFFFEQEKK